MNAINMDRIYLYFVMGIVQPSASGRRLFILQKGRDLCDCYQKWQGDRPWEWHR